MINTVQQIYSQLRCSPAIIASCCFNNIHYCFIINNTHVFERGNDDTL